jgi:hypothetical protein
MTDAQMWIKLYNVIDSVQTEAQRSGAMKYIALWYDRMVLRFNDTSDPDQYLNALDTLLTRELS